MDKLNPEAMGYSGAILSAAGMLLLWIAGKIGLYNDAVEMMQQWHMFFSLSIVGLLTGIIEAAITGFVALYSLAWVYNKFV